ncbi:hypothetical protein V6N12_007575 [Hibiscus sabdariffa]|uniref:Uncharacterized protein n=1 Tax=Hibiscus sabdariffa TaxID=183260 RepID=A0ABR2F292_9ROSI
MFGSDLFVPLHERPLPHHWSLSLGCCNCFGINIMTFLEHLDQLLELRLLLLKLRHVFHQGFDFGIRPSMLYHFSFQSLHFGIGPMELCIFGFNLPLMVLPLSGNLGRVVTCIEEVTSTVTMIGIFLAQVFFTFSPEGPIDPLLFSSSKKMSTKLLVSSLAVMFSVKGVTSYTTWLATFIEGMIADATWVVANLQRRYVL